MKDAVRLPSRFAGAWLASAVAVVLAGCCTTDSGAFVGEPVWRHVAQHEGPAGKALRATDKRAIRVGREVRVEVDARLVDVVQIWHEYERVDHRARRSRGLLSCSRPKTYQRFADPSQPGYEKAPRGIPADVRRLARTRDDAIEIPYPMEVRWSINDATLVGARARVGVTTLPETGLIKIVVDEDTCRDLARSKAGNVGINLAIEGESLPAVEFVVPRAPFLMAAGGRR
ncbi:MAG: hypothetical protein NXI31_05040 [bacterium]|nr:hypothetical protein [bacterium]